MHAAYEICRLDAAGLAADLGMNRSTVNRWIAGTNAPHEALWPRVIDLVMAQLEEKIDALRSIAERGSSDNGVSAA